MPAPPRAAVQHLAALGLAAAVVTTAPHTAASLLDEPPRRTTFNLNETAAPDLPLLGAFRNAAVERPGPLRVYLSSAYGRWQQQPWWQLAWGGARLGPLGETADPLDARRFNAEWGSTSAVPFGALPSGTDPGASLAFASFDPPDALRLAPTAPAWLQRLDPTWNPHLLTDTGPSFSSNGFDVLWASTKKPSPDWRCRRRPVQFLRFGGQRDAFLLVRCDGSVAPGALDRLSIMARPPEAPDPGDALPDEPNAEAWQRAREWVPQIRLVHPRLLWLLQQIADAFPYRALHIFSGYRPGAPKDSAGAPSSPSMQSPSSTPSSPTTRPARTTMGTHRSQHAEGRAMDILVMDIPNAVLFQFCRTLEDVGCGFYPNSKFVHVDVRRPGTGHAFWIDISRPGEPSEYVDAWPGVVERGALVWSGQSSSR